MDIEEDQIVLSLNSQTKTREKKRMIWRFFIFSMFLLDFHNHMFYISSSTFNFTLFSTRVFCYNINIKETGKDTYLKSLNITVVYS